MGAQRRAQAIATAPRRKRYDEDEPEKSIEIKYKKIFDFFQ